MQCKGWDSVPFVFYQIFITQGLWEMDKSIRFSLLILMHAKETSYYNEQRHYCIKCLFPLTYKYHVNIALLKFRFNQFMLEVQEHCLSIIQYKLLVRVINQMSVSNPKQKITADFTKLLYDQILGNKAHNSMSIILYCFYHT